MYEASVIRAKAMRAVGRIAGLQRQPTNPKDHFNYRRWNMMASLWDLYLQNCQSCVHFSELETT